MLFNSIQFVIFLPLVFALYWLLKTPKKQNVLLLIASYIFYGWWDWRFLLLIVFSSFIDFHVGKRITQSEKQAKSWLAVSLIVNLGLLFVFKYFNFFVDSLYESLNLIGVNGQKFRLDLILPVGISFYTFQTLSYSIDVYRKKLKPATDWIAFFAYVSFFPQLVAGPIERATNFLPQFYKKRTFNKEQATCGLRQILWGLFKKVIIADSAALYVNQIFDNPTQFTPLTLVLGALLFSFQIYGDFSGYSDIAIGSAKLFNFKLMRNFYLPYFSRDIAEFWRRWHISLSTWFKDYVYIPLGGSKGSKLFSLRNTLIIFVVSGLWHGANVTFLIWGLLNALYFIPLLLLSKNRKNTGQVAENSLLPSIFDIFAIALTFVQVTFAWIFFRATSISHALQYIQSLFVSIPEAIFKEPSKKLLLSVGIMLILEWIHRKKEHPLDISHFPQPIRWAMYVAIPIYMFFFINITSSVEFIYFQF